MVKQVLITGTSSYIGNQLADWLKKTSTEYNITKKSVRDDKWREIDFSLFDVIVHVAGIAHQDTKADQEDLYYKVNTELTIDIAKKVKEQGVKQFIFLSSIIVYGASSKIGEPKLITRETKPEPINFYGNSKLLAEKGISSLQSENFNVAIVRPPMIYGKGSKGNYPVLAKFAKLLPIFPNIDNRRSMLHIDNLTEFLKLLIEQNEHGLFFPQNNKYVRTSEMVYTISKINGKNINLVKIFNPLLKTIGKHSKLVNKVFGNLAYDQSISEYKKDYIIHDLKESIKYTEI